MRKKELTKEQKAVIEDIKIIWKNNFPNVKIYSDKRKTFYRVKLYMVPVRIARKAKKLAEKFPVYAEVEEAPLSYYTGWKPSYYNCIIKCFYV